jgi:polyferredoxin
VLLLYLHTPQRFFFFKVFACFFFLLEFFFLFFSLCERVACPLSFLVCVALDRRLQKKKKKGRRRRSAVEATVVSSFVLFA